MSSVQPATQMPPVQTWFTQSESAVQWVGTMQRPEMQRSPSGHSLEAKQGSRQLPAWQMRPVPPQLASLEHGEAAMHSPEASQTMAGGQSWSGMQAARQA